MMLVESIATFLDMAVRMEGPLLVLWDTVLVVLPLVLVWLSVVAVRMWWALRRPPRYQGRAFPVLPLRRPDFP